MIIQTVTPDMSRALEIGKNHRWRFRVVGAGVLDSPRFNEGWWLIPTDESIIPGFAMKRINEIKSAGVPIKQIIEAHEAPALLCAPKKAPKVPNPNIEWEPVAKTLIACVVMCFTGALSILGLILSAALIDPAILVVLEDGTRIEVVTWVE